MALKTERIGEVDRVPGEVALPVRVLDVQPDDILGDGVKVKAGVHRLHVRLVVVGPATLVVPQREEGGQGLRA